MVRDARFDKVLINYRLKRAYTWYELRYAVELDFSGIKELINNREISTLFQKLDITSLKKGKQSEEKLAEVVDNIIEDDSVIIENDPDKQQIILRIIELVNPYSSSSTKK